MSEEQENEPKIKSISYKKNLMGVVHTVQPVLKCGYIHGTFVLRLVNDELKPPNWQMKIFSLLVVTAYVIAFCCTTDLLKSLMGVMNFVDTIDGIPRVVVLIQYVTSAITTCFFVRNTRIKILNTFAELDTMLRVESILDFYKKSRSQAVTFLVLLVTTHTINGIAYYVTAESVNDSTIVAFSLDFYHKLQILHFCILIFMLKRRLQFINSYLTTFTEMEEIKNITIFIVRDMKVLTKDQFDFIGRPSINNMKIRDLATMYGLIGKVTSMINEVFNYQIFMTLMSTFTFIVITIWTSLYYYRTTEDNSGPLINVGIWCFSAIYTVASMSFACERLLLVRKESKILVNKIIMNYDLPKTMRVQAKAFMELIDAWPLRIYVYDMFSVDITLMLKFISVATTYLIVIIQISHFI